MDEVDYIKATNRAKVSAAKTTFSDVLPGDEYGITEKQYREIMSLLFKIEQKLFESFEL